MNDGKKKPVAKMDGSRRLLLGATSVLGGISAVGATAPFIVGMRPSRKTQAEGGPIKVEIKDILPGRLGVHVWRLKPIWILRRNNEMLENVRAAISELGDPKSAKSMQPAYCKNETRSIKPDVFVAVGLCTHLGCSPRPNQGDGFLCACHGSRFDFAGRVFKGSPAPLNLIIPPHHYADDNTIVIGEDPPA